MPDNLLTPEQAQTAKVMVSGGFGVFVHMYLRHPGSVLRAVSTLVVGIGVATLFTPVVMPMARDWLSLGEVQVAALLGLSGKALTLRVLQIAENMELGTLLKRKGV